MNLRNSIYLFILTTSAVGCVKTIKFEKDGFAFEVNDASYIDSMDLWHFKTETEYDDDYNQYRSLRLVPAKDSVNINLVGRARVWLIRPQMDSEDLLQFMLKNQLHFYDNYFVYNIKREPRRILFYRGLNSDSLLTIWFVNDSNIIEFTPSFNKKELLGPISHLISLDYKGN